MSGEPDAAHLDPMTDPSADTNPPRIDVAAAEQALRLLMRGGRCERSTAGIDNCFENGLLPISLPEEEVRGLQAEALGGNHVFSIDLAEQTVTSPSGRKLRFEIDPGRKEKLLKGLDAIGETLEHAGDDIARFEHRRSLSAPWLETRA